MFRFLFIVVLIFVLACNRTLVPIKPTSIETKMNASTMERKLLMGYQGWFACPSDGSKVDGYFHWFKNNIPQASSFRVDMMPDLSEFGPKEKCQTNMTFSDGRPAYLYSAYNPLTVKRHFRWMKEYGVDGVFLQRFGVELDKSPIFDHRNVVAKNAQAGAEAYDRVFALMYDTSGMTTETFVDVIKTDWQYVVDTLRLTKSPSYLHHKGKPVLAIWGLGFTEHPGTPTKAMELVEFFTNNPDPKYRVTLVGGVPTAWRTLNHDSLSDRGWAQYYCSLNVISPWTVGRYSSDSEVDSYKNTMLDDMIAAKHCGAQYMPVVFPGWSFHNDSGFPLNAIARRGGNLFWRQVYNAVSLGAPMIYNAMFDEVDEGTAMYKIVAKRREQPSGVNLVSLDIDGFDLPNDWYLRLAGEATKMLRGELTLTQDIPITP